MPKDQWRRIKIGILGSFRHQREIPDLWRQNF
jgi:hypothetical protein